LSPDVRIPLARAIFATFGQSFSPQFLEALPLAFSDVSVGF
jgi:hypothetical protein